MRGFLTYSFVILSIVFAVASGSSKTCINENWRYFDQHVSHPNDLDLDKSEDINLPHTWNTFDPVDPIPGYKRGVGWYAKTIEVLKESGKRYFIFLEAANITSEVWVNGVKAGDHVGGYLSFEIELTSHLKNGNNQLFIKVDNGINPEIVPSQKADFVIYGGITRDVYWVESGIDRITSIQVTTPEVSSEKASTVVSINLDVTNTKNKNLKILFNDTETIIKLDQYDFDHGVVKVELDDIKNPRLWSTEDPYLYKLEVELYDFKNILDKSRESFGYRFFHFEPNGAFFLNGKRLKLRGTHRHEEHAAYGAAMPDSLHRQDMEAIKKMGANFVRLAHYPQDPEIYRACDELGLIVWDELPWCRGGLGNAQWKSNTKTLLTNQIKQNFNHPSIIFWSLGNEIYWLPDFDNGDDRAQINSFLTELNAITKSIDPQRYTAIRKYYEGADIVDVFSPSIWSGWYAGSYVNYEKTLLDNRPKYKRFLHMEYGGSSHVGRHTEYPIAELKGLDEDNWAEVVHQSQIVSIAKSGDWTESYMVDLFDWYLHISENLDWFPGNAQWAFKDFATPLRPENSIPYINQKGLMDRQGNPKDAYYVFKSYWSDDPFIWIESPTWTHRFGAPGDSSQQCVFSNADEVELILNGISLGKRKRKNTLYPAQGLHWDCVFQNGKNDMYAISYYNNMARDTARHSIIYQRDEWGKPYNISLSYQSLDQEGHYKVTALMKDSKGQRVFDYEERVYFDLSGDGKLIINYGTPSRSQVIEFANGKAEIEIIKGDGAVILEARNQNFKGSYITIP